MKLIELKKQKEVQSEMKKEYERLEIIRDRTQGVFNEFETLFDVQTQQSKKKKKNIEIDEHTAHEIVEKRVKLRVQLEKFSGQKISLKRYFMIWKGKADLLNKIENDRMIKHNEGERISGTE